MNQRQKKKLFKKRTGVNPPKWLSYKAPVFHSLTGWSWMGFNRFIKKCEEKKRIRNLENFNRVMTKGRKSHEQRKTDGK